ncbi:DNA/RNA helicase, superfamily II, SNF2 family (plasmid) [Synechococcus sp. PCC 7502]|uniref:DEAD/DEAH box helicase n=1 Tax=Synechococcus sp. PCC 7502 TaxID=1173263 RepID=UPI00029FC114|nr:DEAD/DEAH box helicase [Synechococcus sp. PCC 7502]AFY75460.1 DNA/RNA helicase, superfamily II, SNF2 family [Synechococcus sp. PCC 7502]
MAKWKDVKRKPIAKWKKIKRTIVPPATLEQAIIFLAERCDGAVNQDGQGFNGFDAGYGHWLNQRIETGKPILKKWAASAYKMLSKYKRQLENASIFLPDWEAIANNYLETYPLERAKPKLVNLPEYRLEIHGNYIAAFSPYDPTGVLNEVYKSVSGYVWQKAVEKAWTYDIAQTKNLIDALAQAGLLSRFVIAPEIDQVIAEIEQTKFEQAIAAAEEILELIHEAELDKPLPNGRTLFDHQKEAVQWLLSHREGGIYKGGILADDMGLGKTCSALVAAKAMVKVYNCPILVICPASLKDNWIREAEGVGIAIKVFSWAKLPSPLEQSKYVLIADEAHYAQEMKSARTKGLLALAKSKKCLAAWLLTGTPIKNGRPKNLFPLLVATGHPLSYDKVSYEKYYCAATHKDIGSKSVWDASGAAHLNELSAKTTDIMLRRKKSECLNLPPKIRSFINAEVSKEGLKAYNQEIDELLASYRERVRLNLISDDAEAMVTLGQLRLAGSMAKVETTIAIAEEVLEQGNQVVIFTEFIESAKALHKALGGELLTGATDVKDRQALVDRFQSGESKVFVGTIRAGGVGITLTAASTVILCDRPWTPCDAEQAEDRCNRIGQTNTVNSIWIKFGRVDDLINQIIQQKSERIDLILKGKRKTLRGIASIKDLAKELMEILAS